MSKYSGKNFVCINCGHRMRALYTQYSSSVAQIAKCENCKRPADKYIECEQAIVFIDLFLLAYEANRHVIFNRNFKLFWKLSLILLLLESFALWRQKLTENEGEIQKVSSEKQFYFCCFKNIIDNLVSYVILQIVHVLHCIGRRKYTKLYPLIFNFILLKGITVANLAKFFHLPIMIWKNNITTLGLSIHYTIIMCYYILALSRVYTVAVRISKTASAMTVILIFFFKPVLVSKIIRVVESKFF